MPGSSASKAGSGQRRSLHIERTRARVKKLAAAFVMPAIVSAGVACADPGSDSGPSMFLFSGFGTAGVVHSSENRADFVADGFVPSGAGYTHSWSGAVDSLLGGQVVANLTPQLSAMLQVIAQQNTDNSYTPHAEWANIKYQFTPDVSVRVGRIVLPSFLLSDTRNVGYAYPWVRPPLEVYSLVPIDTNDGADVSYMWRMGSLIHTFTGTYGATTSEEPTGGNADARRQWNISDTVEYGAVTVHLGYQRADLTIDKLHTLLDAFRQFGLQGAALADKYDPYRRPVDFVTVGGSYNPGDWFVVAELGNSQTHSVLGESTAWYVSGGYRLQKFTPYLTYGELKANSNKSDPGLMVAALPANLAGPATELNGALNGILGAIAIQETTSMGVRWDFMKSVDLKIQYDHTRLGAGSPGLLINLQPGFQLGGTVNLFSATVDFVL